MSGVVRFLVVLVLASAAFVDLEIRFPLPFWDFDAPISDCAGAGLIAWWIAARLLGRAIRLPAPPLAPALAFFAIALLSAGLSDPDHTGQSQLHSAWWLLRKPVFCFAAYGIAFPAALATAPTRWVHSALLVMLGTLAALSVGTSIHRIAAGEALWWAPLTGLTNNHKALATFIAPFSAWLFWQNTRGARFVLGLSLVALALALSKTAWLGTALSLAFVVHHRERPLVSRRALAGTVALAALVGLLAVPWLTGDARLQDAARSRRSLDLRAWEMWRDQPAIGQGPGASVGWEQTEYPHYRVNGVEAHGVLQKVAAETGTVGTLAWLAFTALLGRQLAERVRSGSTRDERWAWVGVAAALHLQLLASTDGFTQGHWAPLGLAWWGVFRPPEEP